MDELTGGGYRVSSDIESGMSGIAKGWSSETFEQLQKPLTSASGLYIATGQLRYDATRDGVDRINAALVKGKACVEALKEQHDG